MDLPFSHRIPFRRKDAYATFISTGDSLAFSMNTLANTENKIIIRLQIGKVPGNRWIK